MAEYLPLFTPGQAVTFTASAAVTGGQLVEVTGDRAVAPAAADSPSVVGVAGYDAAAGDPVTVFAGGVQQLVASGAIAAGDRVAAAADGAVATLGVATNPVGTALTAAADGATVQIKLDA